MTEPTRRGMSAAIPWLLTVVAIVMILVVYLAGMRAGASPQPAPVATSQASISFGPSNSYVLSETFSRPVVMTEGDSAITALIVQTTNPLPMSGLVLDTALTATDNCSVQPIDFTRQAMTRQGQSELFAWSVTAKNVGQCILSYRTSILNQRGLYQTGGFSAAQLTIRKPWDFFASFQPYGTALVGLIGSVLGALMTRLYRD
jgi:hypothetical protein